MQRLKVTMLGLVLALVTAALAGGLALAAPSLNLEPWMGAAIGVIAGVSLAAGVIWGALTAPRPAMPADTGRFQSLGYRMARGEAGPEGRALPLAARAAVALTDSERQQHLPGSALSYLRAAGEDLEGGRSSAWEVHYFSQSGRKLLRLQVARYHSDATAYRVTAEMEHLGRWLDTMVPDKQEAAWEALLLRNLEFPPEYADSPAVAATLGPVGEAAAGEAPARRIRSMTVGVARPTLEWAPTIFWIVETDEGKHRFRFYCDILTSEVQRSEQLA